MQNLDIMGRIEEQDDEEDNNISDIFKTIISKNLSENTIPTIIRLLHTQINCIASDICRIKKRAASEKNKHVTFGSEENKLKFS